MKYLMARAGALVFLALCIAIMATSTPAQKGGQSGSLNQAQKPGDNTNGGPPPSKDEQNAYKAIFNLHGSDPSKLIDLGEAFVVKFPDSQYTGGVYAQLASAYFATNNPDKMIVAGTKALEKNPDNIDVLPLLAYTIPRRASPQTPDGAQQLKNAQQWGQHGIDLLTTLPKPADLDDAAFAKAKNEKLSMCHDGLGVAAVKTGKYEEAISQLTQATQLSSTTDVVDYYLLGVANENASHFTDAIAAFTKCSAVDGQLQPTCKGLLDETKKKASTSLEAPK